MFQIILHLVGCFMLSNAVSVSYITPCKADDKACLISSAQKTLPYFVPGIPEFDMPPVDPLDIGSVRSDDKDLTLGFRNLKIYGPSKCKFVDLSRDVVKSTLSMSLECPIRASGQYDLKGKLLFIEAYGDGDFEINTNKVRINVDSNIKTIDGADGKKHWKVTSFDYTYDLIDNVDLRFENLFDGDEARAKPVIEVLNHSSKELVTELGGPIIKELLAKAIHIVNKFYHQVPAESLELA